MPKNLQLSFVLKSKGGKETAGIIALSADNVKRLSNEIAKQGQVSEKSFSKTRKGVESISRQLKTAKQELIGFFSIRAGLGLAKDIFDVNRQMEKLRTQLTALEGSRGAGQAAFGFLQDFAQTAPFQLEELTKTFISLKNFGIEPTDEVMKAITNQASKLGGSAETLSGITLALGQAWAKGKLQGEEILQLVERGVPVYKLLSEATGKNAQQLQEMSSKGQLTRDVISQLITKMGEMASGSNAAQMDTLNGKISNLSDAWHQFEDALLNDKSEGLIKDIVSGATSALNEMTGAIQRASDLSSGALGQTDAIGKLNVKIVEQKQFIKELQKGNLFGINDSRIKSENAKLQNLLSDRVVLLEKYRADLRKNSAQQANEKTFTPNLKSPPNNPGSSGNTGGNNPAKSVIDNLKRQVALYGQTSNVARVRYEIENGSLQKISDKQKTVLLNYAKQLDLLQKTKSEIKSINDLTAAQNDSGLNVSIQEQFKKQLDIAQRQSNSGSSFLPSSINALEQLVAASKSNAATPEATASMQQAIEQLKATIAVSNQQQQQTVPASNNNSSNALIENETILAEQSQKTADGLKNTADASIELNNAFKESAKIVGQQVQSNSIKNNEQQQSFPDFTPLSESIKTLSNTISTFSQQQIKPQQKTGLDKIQNIGSLTLNMITDTGKIAGTIWAEAEFTQRLKSFVDAQTNDAARAVIQ